MNKGDACSRVYQVLVTRLLRCYNPKATLRWNVEPTELLNVPGYFRDAVLITPPISEYVGDYYRSDKYHLGRIHYFCNQITAKRPIEAIEIDNIFSSSGRSVGPVVLDGHHRLIAADLMKLCQIPASYGGLVDGIDWLTGRQRGIPENWL